MASISPNVLIVPNNSGMTQVKPNSPDNSNADGSPFAAMLTATAAQNSNTAPQPSAPSNNDTAADNSDAASQSQSTPTQTSASAQTAPASKTPGSKPAHNNDSAASDNKDMASDISGSQKTDTQPAAAQTQADNSMTPPVQAQLAAQAQTTQAQAQPANDDEGEVPDVGAIAGMPGQLAVNMATGLPKTSAPAGGNPSARNASGQTTSSQASDGQNTADPALPGQSTGQGTPSINPPAASPDAVLAAAAKGAQGDSKAAASDKMAPQTADPAPQAPQPALPVAPNLAAMPSSALPGQNPNSSAVSTAVHVAALAPGAAPDLNSLAVDIAARSQSGTRQFDIRLDPPELGRVEVRLSIDASGKTEAHMTADQPATLSLLQKDSTSLTQALRNAGLDVADNGLNFSLRSQDGQQGQSSSGQGRKSSLGASRAVEAVQNSPAISFNGAAINARLDIHV